MKKKMLILCIAAIAFLLALGITLNTMISTWYNSRHQSQILYKLSRVLGCDIEDLLENPMT